VQALDRAQERHQTALRLRYRSAGEVLELVEGVFGAIPGPRRFKIVADDRTNALIIEASAARLDEIRGFVRDLDRPVEGAGGLHVVAAKSADAERLAELVRAATSPAGGRGGDSAALTSADYAIAVDAPTNSLLIRAAPETFRLLSDLIHELDQVPPIVSIEVLLVEISTTRALRLALDALVPLGVDPGEQGNRATILQNTSGTPIGQPSEDALFRLTREPLVIPVVTPEGETIAMEVPADNVVILAKEAQIYTRVLLNPHLIAMSGDEQRISVGDNIPIPVSRVPESGAVDPLTVQQNIERRDVGVILNVKPTVGVEGGVELELRLEASRLAPSEAGDVERVGPTIRQRTIEATFKLQDDQLAVIGTHVQPRFIEIQRGVPWLSEIPILGALFRSTTDQAFDTHLVIAVQTRLLRSPADEAAESIRRRLAFQRHLAGLEALQEATQAPYALLAATRSRRSDAEAIAENLVSPEGRAKVITWETYDGPRYDVYLTGFQDLTEVGKVSLALRELGWTPSVVVVPETLPR
jgi:general secretion pathway protein D